MAARKMAGNHQPECWCTSSEPLLIWVTGSLWWARFLEPF
jgi:hypothetical protein